MEDKIKVYVDGIGEVHIERNATLEELSKQVYDNN